MTTRGTGPTTNWLKWTYLSTTALLIAWMLSSGLMALSRATPIVEAISGLGYPSYFVSLLGLSKMVEAAVLLLPAPRELRTWAYAGATFEVLAAAFSYAASYAGVGEVSIPLGFLVLIQASFWSWRFHSSRAATQPTDPLTFDPRKFKDTGFVRVYRALDVGMNDLRPLTNEITDGNIHPEQDVFIVGEQGGRRIAVTLWNLAYHHLAQGELTKGQPFLLSFCPVCNSGMVFDPRINGKLLRFRVGGVASTAAR